MSQTPGRIQKADPPEGSVIYTIGILQFRIGGSTFESFQGSGIRGRHYSGRTQGVLFQNSQSQYHNCFCTSTVPDLTLRPLRTAKMADPGTSVTLEIPAQICEAESEPSESEPHSEP